MVLQVDELLALSTVLVAPTSTRAAPATFRPLIEVNGTATRVLVEQATAIDATRAGHTAGRLDATELRDVEDALRLVLGL